MSPVTDDVVLFVVLAAGLTPVLAPLDPQTGNIDPTAIADSAWESVQGVLTSNLYGIPDHMDRLEQETRRHHLVLIEDAAHAIESHFDGRRIGTFGASSVFSFSKHLGVPGGILAFSDADLRESLARRAEEALRPLPFPVAVADLVRLLMNTAGIAGRGRTFLNLMLKPLIADMNSRSGHRMLYTVEDVVAAAGAGANLDPFDRWVRTDNGSYRTPPPGFALPITLRRLETLNEMNRVRREGTRKLLELNCAPSELPVSSDTALLRVPLFVRDRERVIERFTRRGLSFEYIYDPPFDVYAPALTEALPSPPAARIWSHNVLPVDPARADLFLALHAKLPELCRPALTRSAPGRTSRLGA